MTLGLPADWVFVVGSVVITGGLMGLVGSILHSRARAAIDDRYRISLDEVKRKYGVADEDGSDEGHGQVDALLVVVLVVVIVLLLLGHRL